MPHAELPLFVYGTLRNDRKYCDDIRRYNPRIETAYCYGNLYYNDFIDAQGEPCVTVALDCHGVQRVKGQLFSFDARNYYEMLAEFDDKEFNFCDLTPAGRHKTKDRVYIRSVIDCITERGKIVQAYSYIYVSKAYPLQYHPPVNDDLSFDVPVEYPALPPSHAEYRRRLEELARRYKVRYVAGDRLDAPAAASPTPPR